MTSNPYAPPLVAVEDVETSTATTLPPFFAVAPWKLALMSLCTAGLYEVFWFYKHWRRIKQREKARLMPAPRAIFSVLFCYACFKRIAKYETAGQPYAPLKAGALATGWILCTLLSKLPSPFLFVSLIAFMFLMPVQAHANRINALEAPGHDRNDRLTLWNWLLILPCSALLLLIVAALIIAG